MAKTKRRGGSPRRGRPPKPHDPNARYVPVRMSGKDIQTLEALMELWGVNQSQCIRRALHITYSLEKTK